MARYGHDLQFGVFLTPSSDAPQQVVDLAVLAERVGLDLVTIQDHPYLPTHLDTWTLLSWIAGRTERIHLAPNVLNIPLRQPAVAARAAASLDLLSHGRLELGLGAGAYWTAIAALGVPRLSPGESIDAMQEALAVVRAMLDTNADRRARVDGIYHRLDGAQAGPTPAHEIPILLGAAKPRMLRLLGAEADGWIATQRFLPPDGLATGNAIIDAAAREAGRDPREIRRILNIDGRFAEEREAFLDGPPEQWVDDLLPLALNDGVSTFILMTDDALAIKRFAGEVAPAMREAFYRIDPQAQHPLRQRRASVRARRRDGIAYDVIPASLAERAVEPGDVGYAELRSNYLRGGSPGLILRPQNRDEVVEALAFARQHPDLPLGIRSGGHGISGRSTNDGGIVIDLGALNSIEVIDSATRLVRIGPGARWMDVAEAIAPYGWAISSGDYGGVGVGGLATAGGIGWLAREHGLTIDHVRAVEMVLADGSVVRADERENADLFWAARGAGANFGIVTSFEIEADVVGNIGWAQLLMDASDTATFLQQWGALVEAAPRDLTSFLIVSPPRNNQPAIAWVLAVVDSSDPAVIVDRIQPLATIAPLYDHQIAITTYAGIMANAAQGYHSGRGEPAARSGLVHHITPELAAGAAEMINNRSTYYFQIRSVGGAVADVPDNATAYAHRDANFHLTAFGTSHQRLGPLWDALQDQMNGIYLSFDTDPRPERIADAFPPATLERLRELKRRYDPNNVFRDNFNIQPAPQPVLVESTD
ncbi:MAG: LLM class flavin-dependent oxidoreductase [Thermomicrobiales bacterium]|nr:LLM class flavin-dependent oxidoreductase [Thermomicrobiales bacterium]